VFEFRVKAILDWHRLQHELNGSLEMNCNGSLWWEDDMKAVEKKAQESTSWGYPMRIVSRAEARKQEPFLRQHPDQSVYSAIEGSVPPLQTARLLLNRAAAGGAVIHTDTVLALTVERGRVTGVRTRSGLIKADKVILAAGEASEALSTDIGVVLPMANLAGFLAQSVSRPPLLHGIVLAPRVHMRQCVDGRILVGWDFGGSEVPDYGQSISGNRPHTQGKMLQAKIVIYQQFPGSADQLFGFVMWIIGNLTATKIPTHQNSTINALPHMDPWRQNNAVQKRWP
jgi:glycine/D-amino acid oxidase-like deaminating enzyme